MSDRSITLYLINARDGLYELVTDHGESVATITGDVYSVLPNLHMFAEITTESLVKIVTRVITITRLGGEVVARPTEDTDDPILNRLTKMIRGEHD